MVVKYIYVLTNIIYEPIINDYEFTIYTKKIKNTQEEIQFMNQTTHCYDCVTKRKCDITKEDKYILEIFYKMFNIPYFNKTKKIDVKNEIKKYFHYNKETHKITISYINNNKRLIINNT